MSTQNGENKRRQGARWGLFALAGFAAGLGVAALRLKQKTDARRWQAHMERAEVRTALVTGASAGIGRAYAARLAQMGYQLVLVARRVERLEALAVDYHTRFGVRVEALPADLSTEEGIARVEGRLAAGDVDFLVNSAGYDVFGDFAGTPIEKLLGLIRCQELSIVRLDRAALPGMLERRRGAIVNVSSIGAFTPKRKDAAYVGSKAFVNRFTESLALELKGTGVRAQALCPGFTLTEFHDAPEYASYHIKERIPGWMWMKPEAVVAGSLQALGENRVVYLPGVINRLIAAAGQSGLSQLLMRLMGNFLGVRPAALQPGDALEVLACPDCHARLSLQGTSQDGKLECPRCGKAFPIVESIPRFAAYAALTGFNRRFAGLYDWFSIIYRLFSKVAFVFIGTNEDRARMELTDKLEPCGRVLEVSIGPGVNLPYLREYPEVHDIYGLDLSNGQLARCQSYARREGWQVALAQGNAEALPYLDNTFDCVLHMGGINFFNDKEKAIREMIRVARPGAKIVISDENERGARGYEVTLPGFKQSFKGPRQAVKPPIDLVPAEMQAVKLDEELWNGWFYAIQFRKPG